MPHFRFLQISAASWPWILSGNVAPVTLKNLSRQVKNYVTINLISSARLLFKKSYKFNEKDFHSLRNNQERYKNQMLQKSHPDSLTACPPQLKDTECLIQTFRTNFSLNLKARFHKTTKIRESREIWVIIVNDEFVHKEFQIENTKCDALRRVQISPHFIL